MNTHEQIIEAKAALIKLVVKDWKNDVFSPIWFGTVAFIGILYFIVFKLLDKKRIIQLLLFGSFMTVGITLLDIFGTEFVFWTYLTRIFPIVPSLFLYDFTIIPLCYMMVYQYGSNWKSFSLLNAILAGLISFGLLPLMTLLKMFELNNWRYIYFFPIIFAFASFSRAVLLGFISLQKKKHI